MLCYFDNKYLIQTAFNRKLDAQLVIKSSIFGYFGAYSKIDPLPFNAYPFVSGL